MTLMVKKLLDYFMKKNWKKKSKRLEKVIKKMETSYMSNGNVMIIHLIPGLIKKTLYKMGKCFPKLFEPFGGDINVIADLSN